MLNNIKYAIYWWCQIQVVYSQGNILTKVCWWFAENIIQLIVKIVLTSGTNVLLFVTIWNEKIYNCKGCYQLVKGIWVQIWVTIAVSLNMTLMF